MPPPARPAAADAAAIPGVLAIRGSLWKGELNGPRQPLGLNLSPNPYPLPESYLHWHPNNYRITKTSPLDSATRFLL